MAILFLQRSASEAYELTSTLKNNLIPGDTTMKGASDVRDWIASVVTTTWQDARCGDGRCEAPFEYPEYGRFGCKADCNLLKSAAQITPIQIDVYFNFSHPKGSVSPIDLMQDAAWNLCPMEVDELIGPKKIFHGSDCYYQEDQKFEEQVGHIVREIDDVPDGDWSVVVKKDIFLKVAGAVRPRLNVTVEAKNKRLLLAAHYGQIRRKYEVESYQAIKMHLSKTNLTIAHAILDLKKAIANDTLITANASAATPGSIAGNESNPYMWDLNQTALINEYTLNETMVNASLRAGSDCLAQHMTADYLNVTDFASVPITLYDGAWNWTTESLQDGCQCVVGAEDANDAETYCYCYGPDATTNPNLVNEPNTNTTLSLADAKKRACTETWRWILLGKETSWNRHLDIGWSLNLGAQELAASVADTEFESVLTWLSQLSPVTFFEINQMKGTDVNRLDEASLTTLKNDNVLSERSSDGNATVVANALRLKYPYYEELIELIDARLANVNTNALTLPLYMSPPEFPFNFTYMVEGSLDIANALYPDDDLHAEVDVDIVEWNPAVLARQQYAFMTCNLEDRAEQYVGTCIKPEDAVDVDSVTDPTAPGPMATDPEYTDGRTTIYLSQTRFQRLCEGICYCEQDALDENGQEIVKKGCATIAGPDHYCSCNVCRRTAQFDNVEYPANVSSASRKLLSVGFGDDLSSAEFAARGDRWSVPHRRHLLENGPARRRQGPNSRRLLQTDLDTILTAVQDLSVKQSQLDTNVQSVKDAQAIANQDAEQHHSDTSLETIIKAGFDDLKKGTDSLSTSLEEILAKQQQALAAAQESLAIQERTNALAESAERSISRLEAAVQKQRESIQNAYQSGAFADTAQYVAIQEDAVITRERKAKENLLMNSPCQMKVLYYSFSLDNFNNTEPPIAYRERFVGLNNRVLAGMLVYVERKNLMKCTSSRFDDIDSTCSGGRDIASYGVDPVFKLGTPLYNADYDNYETLTKVYNCSEFSGNVDGLSATYNDGSDDSVTGNFAPYCQELYNARDIPYGFRHKALPGYAAGTSLIIPI